MNMTPGHGGKAWGDSTDDGSSLWQFRRSLSRERVLSSEGIRLPGGGNPRCGV